MADDSENFVIKVSVENADKAVGDLSKVDKAEQQAEKSNRKLSQSNNRVGNSFAGMAKNIIAVAASYITLRVAMKSFWAVANEGQRIFANTTMYGLDSDKLQQMGQAARRFGGNIESVSRTVRSLRQQIVGLQFGEQNGLTEAMRLFGLNTVNSDGSFKNYEELLESVAERMESLTPEMQERLANLLGLSPDVFAMVRRGLQQYREMLKEQTPVFSKKFTDAANEFKAAWAGAENALMKFGGKVGEELLPKLTLLTEKFTLWMGTMSENETVIQSVSDAVYEVSKGVMAVVEAYGKLLILSGKAGTKIGEWWGGIQTNATTPLEYRTDISEERRKEAKRIADAQSEFSEKLIDHENREAIDAYIELIWSREKARKEAMDANFLGLPFTKSGKRVSELMEQLGEDPMYWEELNYDGVKFTIKPWSERKKIREAKKQGMNFSSFSPSNVDTSPVNLEEINGLTNIPFYQIPASGVDNSSKVTNLQFYFDGIASGRSEYATLPTPEEIARQAEAGFKRTMNELYILMGNNGLIE